LSAVAAVLAALHPRLPVFVRQSPAVRLSFVLQIDHSSSRVAFGQLRAVAQSAADDVKDDDAYEDDEQKYESERQPDDEHFAVV